MKDIALADLNDVQFYQDLGFVDGPEQIAQSAQIIMQSDLGEFTLEPNFGLTRANLITRKLVPDYIISDISDALISQSQQIVSVDDFEFRQDKRTRALSIAFNIAIAGQIELVRVEVVLND